jgi:hypothetical protein
MTNQTDTIDDEVMERVLSTYRVLFQLSPEDEEIVRKNLHGMTAEDIQREILLINNYHTQVQSIEKESIIQVVQYHEDAERKTETKEAGLSLNF